MEKDHAKQGEKEQIEWTVCKLANKNNLCRNQYQCISRGIFQYTEVLLKTQWKMSIVGFFKIEIFWQFQGFRTSVEVSIGGIY